MNKLFVLLQIKCSPFHKQANSYDVWFLMLGQKIDLFIENCDGSIIL